MKCRAILFNLEHVLNKSKTATNNFLTFVDADTGESFRTFVDSDIAAKYRKMKEYDMSLSISVSEYQGRPQLNVRILEMTEIQKVPAMSTPKTA